jgi:RNA polymerase sigma factor (sigma-70 family)
METLCALPQELWTVEQLNAELPRNTFEADLSTEDAMAMLSDKRAAAKLISGLTKREQAVLALRYGQEKTLEESGGAWDVTGQRIRQIESRARRRAKVSAMKMSGIEGFTAEQKKRLKEGWL